MINFWNKHQLRDRLSENMQAYFHTHSPHRIFFIVFFFLRKITLLLHYSWSLCHWHGFQLEYGHQWFNSDSCNALCNHSYSLTIQPWHISGWKFRWTQLTNSRYLDLKHYTTSADRSDTVSYHHVISSTTNIPKFQSEQAMHWVYVETPSRNAAVLFYRITIHVWQSTIPLCLRPVSV